MSLDDKEWDAVLDIAKEVQGELEGSPTEGTTWADMFPNISPDEIARGLYAFRSVRGRQIVSEHAIAPIRARIQRERSDLRLCASVLGWKEGDPPWGEAEFEAVVDGNYAKRMGLATIAQIKRLSACLSALEEFSDLLWEFPLRGDGGNE